LGKLMLAIRKTVASVAVIVFDGHERLDVEGPLAVLGWVAKFNGHSPTIRLLSKNGIAVKDHLLGRWLAVDGSTKNETGFDLLIVPGGDPSKFICDQELVDEVGRLGAKSMFVASVCTGAFLVAKAGLLNGMKTTTHWQFSDAFARMFPSVTLERNKRFVHDGSFWSSAGISAGIDMSLQIVIFEWGEGIAKQAQTALQYCPEIPFQCSELTPSQVPVGDC
jgi:transcriptional regulator GlxA family with amidase domain